DVTDYKKETLDIDGKTYVLKTINGDESGDLSVGTHEVTYIYALQEIKEIVTEKTGKLIVNYLDADGKAIQSPVFAVSERVIEKTIETITLIDGVEVDRKVETISTPYNYDVSEYLEETLTIDGVVYQLTEVQGQVNGALGAGQPAINLVYQVKPQLPNVPVTPDPKPQEPTTPKPQEPTTPKPQEPTTPKPQEPTTPETDPTNPTPQKPGEVTSENPASTPIPVTSEVKGQALLPNTGEASDLLLFSAASLSILMGLGLVSKKSKDQAQD
ncbi:TPA: MucBP domain-containing protein, partial [Streptococcus suis]